MLVAFTGFVFSAGTQPAQDPAVDVSVCDLANHPKSFDGKTICVRGTLSVAFEDFTLGTKECDSRQATWLAFGGDVPGIVASTVNDSFSKPNTNLTVNGVPYGIRKHENFRRLYALIAARHERRPLYRVTATLQGAFFAGKETELPSGRIMIDGYGHLGCCALFVITDVSDVESVPSANLNVHGPAKGPDSRALEGFIVFDDILGGSPPERQQTATNAKGEFTFSNSGQLLRFENPRYQPLALPIETGRHQREA